MTELTLDIRTFEDDDGTWTKLEFDYSSPWQAGGEGQPRVYVWIKTFQRKPDGDFDFEARPESSQFICLDEVNIGMLAGYLTTINELLWRQWTQYERQQSTKPTGD